MPALLDDENVRQILHITYGLILQSKSAKDKYLFSDRMYEHIGKHVEKLNIEKITHLK